MKIKHLLISLTAIATVTPAFAATYYVTPEGAGTKDGSSWENALGVEELQTKVTTNKTGDTYNFAGGKYNFNKTLLVSYKTAANLIGAETGERTVFSGDVNGDGVASEGDLSCIVRIQTQTSAASSPQQPALIKNIDFTCAYTASEANSDGQHEVNGVTGPGALFVDNSYNVTVENCNFYGNKATGLLGGAAIHLRRSFVTFNHCNIHDNSGISRGGAVRLRSDNATKGITTFYDCAFYNNTLSKTDVEDSGRNGGAIYLAQGKQLNIINCTLTNNESDTWGSAIYTNGAGDTFSPVLNIINSTIAGNKTVSGGAQISTTQTASIKLANTIIASKYETTDAIAFNGETESPKFSFETGGYNFISGIRDLATSPAKDLGWKDTDKQGAEYNYAAIFGSNALTAEGVIKPNTFFAGATGEEVTAAVTSWGLPAGLDLTTDQLGNERIGQVTPGAYAVSKDNITTNIITSIADDSNARLVNLGAGVYAIEGVEGVVTVYNINGATVMTSPASSIDLGAMPAGLYIVKAQDTIFKVMR